MNPKSDGLPLWWGIYIGIYICAHDMLRNVNVGMRGPSVSRFVRLRGVPRMCGCVTGSEVQLVVPSLVVLSGLQEDGRDAKSPVLSK